MVTAVYKKIKPILSSPSRILRLGIFVLIKHNSTMTTQSSRSFVKSSLLPESNDREADARVHMGG